MECKTGRWPEVAPRVTSGSGDMVDMRKAIDFPSWEHMLADGGEERQGRPAAVACETSLVKSRP